MSVDARNAEAGDQTCDHCETADGGVEPSYLAPVGNLVAVQACADCRAHFGTVADPSDVGEVHGLTAPDGVCLVCRADASFSVELEAPVAGQIGYVSGSLCSEHATLHTDAILASVGEGQDE